MEIVDQEIEKLLPTFRAAIHCELLDEDEVKDIVRRRKKAEGKLIKREAEIRDFIDFVSGLNTLKFHHFEFSFEVEF